jgi:hypothetical protein
LLHNEEDRNGKKLRSCACFSWKQQAHMKKGELERWWGAKLLCLQTPTTTKKGAGELRLPLFFFFSYVCLFQEEVPIGFAITMFFTE